MIKNIKPFISIFILISILMSCSSDKETKAEAEKQVKGARDKLIGSLISQYDIQYMWDTIEYPYSIEYKPILSSKYQLIDDFEVSDICEKDSGIYLSIKVAHSPAFFFLLSVNSDQANEILNTDKITDLILVVDIQKFKKILFDIENEIEYDSYSVGGGEDSEEFYESYAISSPSFSYDFVGMGNVIDVFTRFCSRNCVILKCY